MSLNTGPVVNGTIRPVDSQDGYAVTDDQYNAGGFRVVATLADLQTITPERQKKGMQAVVQDTLLTYVLTVEGSSPTWLIDTGNAIPYLGAFATDPTETQQGQPIQVGYLYLNTSDTPNKLRVYTAAGWADYDQSAQDASASAAASAGTAAQAAINAQTGTPNRGSMKAALAAALPAHTYNAGVIAASGNGAFPAIDGQAVGVGDNFLNWDYTGKGGANLEYGPYVLTDAGSGSTPWIAARTADTNTAATLGQACVLVNNGGPTWGGYAAYVPLAPAAITLGTTPIPVAPSNSTGGVAGVAAAVAALHTDTSRTTDWDWAVCDANGVPFDGVKNGDMVLGYAGTTLSIAMWQANSALQAIQYHGLEFNLASYTYVFVQFSGQSEATGVAIPAMTKGIISTTITAPGSGGTNGTFPLGVSGGDGQGVAGSFTVSGGALTKISLLSFGDNFKTVPPTFSFVVSAGLSGATATGTISGVIRSDTFSYGASANPQNQFDDAYAGISNSAYDPLNTGNSTEHPAVSFAWTFAIGLNDGVRGTGKKIVVGTPAVPNTSIEERTKAGPPVQAALTSLAWLGGIVTATAQNPHNVPNGQTWSTTISGATPSGYNGTYTATATGASTFTYAISNPGSTPATGTLLYTQAFGLYNKKTVLYANVLASPSLGASTICHGPIINWDGPSQYAQKVDPVTGLPASLDYHTNIGLLDQYWLDSARDAAAAFNQPFLPPWFQVLCGPCWSVPTTPPLTVNNAQLDWVLARRALRSAVWALATEGVMPKKASGGPHPQAPSAMWSGSQFAMQVLDVMSRGLDKQPPYIAWTKIKGNVIYLGIKSAYPLQSLPYYFISDSHQNANMGFCVIDVDGPTPGTYNPVVKSAAFVGSNIIALTCNRAPDPATYRVIVGLYSTAISGEYFGGTNVFDTDPRTAFNLYPSLGAFTTIGASSDGATLPQATIYGGAVIGSPFTASGSFKIWSNAGVQTVNYTGYSGGNFTGCTGGTGVINTGFAIAQGAMDISNPTYPEHDIAALIGKYPSLACPLAPYTTGGMLPGNNGGDWSMAANIAALVADLTWRAT